MPHHAYWLLVALLWINYLALRYNAIPRVIDHDYDRWC